MNLYVVLLYDWDTGETHIMGIFIRQENAVEFILQQPDKEDMKIEIHYLRDHFEVY